MPTVTLYLRGDQIGRYANYSGSGNGVDRVVTVNGVRAVGTADQIYTVIVEQVNAGATEFQNGQFITILDPDGNVLSPRSSVQPDIEQGQGDGDEHLILQNQPYLIDLGGVPLMPTRVIYSQPDQVAAPGVGDNDGHLDFADFPCFAVGTMIGTPGGPRDVAELTAGCLVETADHGSVPILWTGRRVLDLAARDSGKPVVIKEGFLGMEGPSADTVVSPDHRILVCDPACDLLFGVPEVLAPAKGLLGLPRTRELRGRKTIEYVTLMTARHEVIYANDLPVETLYPGAQALRRIGLLGRAEVLSLLPRLRVEDVSVAYPAARPLLSVNEAEALSQVLRLRQQVNNGKIIVPERLCYTNRVMGRLPLSPEGLILRPQ